MPYEVRYSDEANKGVIIVEDSLINNDTSLQIPGKNSTGYGKAVAENFLNLLENFSAPNEPSTPVEGQLWYDTSGVENQLKVYDSTQWKTASGFTKSSNKPTASQSTPGDLWVDINNQQLFVYTGNGWVLIGPETSLGLLTGGKTEEIITTSDTVVKVFTLYLENIPYAILSGTNFTPKAKIDGFSQIQKGLTIRDETPFEENNPIKFVGVAEKSRALVVSTSTGSETVAAENFIRTDTAGTIDNELRIKTNEGLKVGAEDQLSIRVNGSNIEIRNNKDVSSIDMILRDNQAFNPVLRATSARKVGINNTAPEAELHIIGNVKITPGEISAENKEGTLQIYSITESTSISTGSIQTSGGVGIAQSLNVGGSFSVAGVSTFGNNVLPLTTEQYNIGSADTTFNNIYASTFIGSVTGDVTGRLNGIADKSNKLATSTTFTLSGDVEESSFDFDGATGGSTKTFNIAIKNSFIASRDKTTNVAGADEILINVTAGDTGVRRVTKQDFIKTVPITPVGSILPFGGTDAPAGWLICDGTVVQKSSYNNLWQVIKHNFLDPSLLADGGDLTFAIPDMRGRMPLGVDNMGGTPANRVTGSIQSFTNIQGINSIGTGSDAVFSVQANNGTYSVQVTNPGQNYQVADKIVVSGVIFGGATPVHDLIITVDSVQNNGIKTFSILGNAFTGIGAEKIGAALGSQSTSISTKNLPEHDHKLAGQESQFYSISPRSEDPSNPGNLMTDTDAEPLAIESGVSAFQGKPITGGVNTSAGLSVPLSVMNPYLSLNYIIYHGNDS